MIYVLGILFVLLLAFAILSIRAVLLKEKLRSSAKVASAGLDLELNKVKIVADMQALLRHKTIAYADHAKEDESAFQDFKEQLIKSFPHVNAACTCSYIGRRGILYHWPGQDKHSDTSKDTDTNKRSDTSKYSDTKAAWLFMSHYDVVPVNEEAWTRAPFGGEVVDGVIWGRGTLDTKGTLLGIMEAAEQLIQNGFSPERDFYFAFSGEEEIYGSSAADIVLHLEKQGVALDLVLDEGGAVVEKVLPGVKQDAALVGIAEKGILNLELKIRSQGGHASTPPCHSTVGAMAQAILRLEQQGFKPKLTFPVEQMLLSLAKPNSFGLRLIAANLWFFKPLLFVAAKKLGGELRAMLYTTLALTQLQGSTAINVMPAEVSCGMNLRILPGESRRSALEHIKKLLQGTAVEVSVIGGRSPCRSAEPPTSGGGELSHTGNMNNGTAGSEPSRISTLANTNWETLTNVIQNTWDGCIVAPYLMLAASDSRHYGRISDKVYRFSAMKLSKEERSLIHSHDERVPLETLYKTVEFYIRLIRAS